MSSSDKMVPAHQPIYHMTIPCVLMKMKNVFCKLLWSLQWRVPPHGTACTRVYFWAFQDTSELSLCTTNSCLKNVTFFILLPTAISSFTPLCFHLILKSAPRFLFPVGNVVLLWVKLPPSHHGLWQFSATVLKFSFAFIFLFFHLILLWIKLHFGQTFYFSNKLFLKMK